MGCVSSKRNINNLHPNIYEVVNVDKDGNKVSFGQLEVTETELILHQKHKARTVWPIKHLRRYGADSELFSFESGRRAPTGEGIFAFRCQRAEQLLSHLQAKVTAEENAAANASVNTPDSSDPSGYLEPTQPRNVGNRQRQLASNGRVDSIHSSGPVSPPPISPPASGAAPLSSPPQSPANGISPPITENIPFVSEELEDAARPVCDDSNNNQPPYINYEIIEVVQLSSSKDEPAELSPPVLAPRSYMNVEISREQDPSSHCSDALCNCARCNSEAHDSNGEVLRDHLYMNVVPGYENAPAVPAEERVPPEGVAIIAKPVSGVPLPFVPKASKTCGPLTRGNPIEKLKIGHDSEEDIHPTYSNFSPSDREDPGFAATPTSVPTVNYAVLDLNPPPLSPASSLTPTGAHPESPHGHSSGYVLIDFHKTEALSHSVNPNLMDFDHEGCRKTRHNSTISDLPTPVE
ncbi:Fibroblast growth factor receptor substrate 2 [Frankliniella fusca]|uniref:Fibroblast growth factor receptor substrate 2 n=1 Tax=Frankliniella fusca TaxID=407009 RepID=A0AAE1H295_9NEOP|nr:Fibroblast growth factor receptor substrate 2 [Frankliniella fusca]